MLVVTVVLRYVILCLYCTFSLACLSFDDNCSLVMQLKPGGRIPEKGKITTLHVKDVRDLSRDVIKVCHDDHHNFQLFMKLFLVGMLFCKVG